MIRIDVPIQNDHPGDGLDRVRDSVDRFRLATFTEVWYTLNQWICDF